MRFPNMFKNKKEGKVVLGNGIINGIVFLAVQEIPHVQLFSNVKFTQKKCDSIKVSSDRSGVNVTVSVLIHYTESVSDMAFKIQESIRHNVEAMTQYKITGVNVIVRGVLFDEEDDENNKKRNDNNTKPRTTKNKTKDSKLEEVSPKKEDLQSKENKE